MSKWVEQLNTTADFQDFGASHRGYTILERVAGSGFLRQATLALENINQGGFSNIDFMFGGRGQDLKHNPVDKMTHFPAY